MIIIKMSSSYKNNIIASKMICRQCFSCLPLIITNGISWFNEITSLECYKFITCADSKCAKYCMYRNLLRKQYVVDNNVTMLLLYSWLWCRSYISCDTKFRSYNQYFDYCMGIKHVRLKRIKSTYIEDEILWTRKKYNQRDCRSQWE